jgi:endoglucanase
MSNHSLSGVHFTILLVAAAIVSSLPKAHAALTYTGVNLAGADFGESNLPGAYNTHYTYPRTTEVDYFVGKGMNTFRVPFRWERLQRSQDAPLNASELSRLSTIVNYATGEGAYVVLDPHNYARYFGNVVGTASLPNASLADFWSRLASEFKDNERVIFGLMNEPHTMPTEQWRDAANAAIAAIRDTGATNLILVPGNAWTGAHSWTQIWYGTPNAIAMLDITDPGNNFAFDVHQYLDSNSSGGSSQIVSETIGQERLVGFTNWLRTNNRRGFLGEFAVANSQIGEADTQIGDEAIHHMLNYVEDNDDVWLGWTWWAAGPWWGNYRFTLEPTNLGQPNQTDRPALAVLQPHLAASQANVPGDYDSSGTIDAADYIVWRNTLGQSGSGLAADGNDDEQIDGDDYAIWRANFGQSNNGAHGAAQRHFVTPEPTTALLLLHGLVLLLAHDCRSGSARANPAGAAR